MKCRVIESIAAIKNLFEKIPMIKDIEIINQTDHSFSIVLKEAKKRNIVIDVDVLKQAVPRSVKNTIEQSCDHTFQIIMAPYISEKSAKLCEEKGVGYCDLSGNCLIQTDSIYISNKGNPNQYPVKNPAKTIFKSSAITTSLILRELMSDVSKTWKIKELAEKVGCSIGMVSRIKTYLCDQLWAEMDSSGLRITDAEMLMREWSRAYEMPESVNCYTLDSIPLFEDKCFRAFKDYGINLCLTGFSGGVRYVPVVRYTKIHIWIERKDIEAFLKLTDSKIVDSGANIVLYIADSREVFTNHQEIQQSRVASPVQIYLDCMQLKGRGEEIAETILSKEIASVRKCIVEVER